jgi:hypothetical protein
MHLTPIPAKLRQQIAQDPYMKACIYPHCYGKPEWEHAFLYANKRINEAWAIVPVCTYHHRMAGLDKRYNEYHALRRASDADLAKYPRRDWKALKTHLNSLYDTK